MNKEQSSWGLSLFVALGLAAILGGFGIFSAGLKRPANFIPQPPGKPSQTNGNFPNTPESQVISDRSLTNLTNVPKGIFNYGGSTTFAPLRSDKIIAAINKIHPEFKLRYTEPLGGKEPGSGTGIEMLIEGQLAFSQSSRAVKDKEFDRAKTRGFTIKQIPVAIDGIAFYVSPKLMELGLKGINLEQARKIFTGQITNWEEVGGPNIQITAFSRNLKAGGTVDFFYEEVLKKQQLAESVREVQDTTDSIRKVARTPGGIGYATASEVVNQQTINLIPLAKDTNSDFVSPCANETCKSVNQEDFADGSYPLTRRLFVVIKQDNGLDQEAGNAYANMILSDEGQNFVEEVGFVPIRK
jgi:phosphate transport system substrate-binding protein